MLAFKIGLSLDMKRPSEVVERTLKSVKFDVQWYGYEQVCLTWLKQNVSFQSRVKHPCVQIQIGCSCFIYIYIYFFIRIGIIRNQRYIYIYLSTSLLFDDNKCQSSLGSNHLELGSRTRQRAQKLLDHQPSQPLSQTPTIPVSFYQ